MGGKARVEMARLKQVFEALGFEPVKTYINSGNVVFREAQREHAHLADIIEAAIEKEFGFKVIVVVRSLDNIQEVTAAIPPDWTNDQTMKCDVMFLWEDVDAPTVLDDLLIKPEMEDVKYVPGAVIWRVDRPNVTKSGMLKLIGTPLYKQMTIRNCNTVRKLATMMQEIA